MDLNEVGVQCAKDLETLRQVQARLLTLPWKKTETKARASSSGKDAVVKFNEQGQVMAETAVQKGFAVGAIVTLIGEEKCMMKIIEMEASSAKLQPIELDTKEPKTEATSESTEPGTKRKKRDTEKPVDVVSMEVANLLDKYKLHVAEKIECIDFTEQTAAGWIVVTRRGCQFR